MKIAESTDKVSTSDQGEQTPDIPIWAFPLIYSLLEALRQVDSTVYHHCLRVGDGSWRLAQDLGLSEHQQRVIGLGGLLHDLGKMGVDPGIIHKPGKLNDLEMDHMKAHVLFSVRILQPLAEQNPFFAEVSTAVQGHHERIDGKGYPNQVPGEKIPFSSKVISVIDTLDAMSQDRAYRKGLPIDVVYRELARCSGTQFEPHVVSTFLESHRFWEKNRNVKTWIEALEKEISQGSSVPIEPTEITTHHPLKRAA